MRRVLLSMILLLCGATHASNGCDARPLNILLTNDDGHDTVGIVALHRALNETGHKVKRVAPERNFSGSSASVAFHTVSAQKIAGEFADVYAVAGTPATAVLLGATAIFGGAEQVDLVISGINEGANLGPATPISGTVGATIAAMKILIPPVAGIAVSTNPIGKQADSADNESHAANVARFVARLVTALQCSDQPWSDGTLALNVNYPPLPPDRIRGVRIASQGRTPYFAMRFKPAGENRYSPEPFRPEALPDVDDSDTALFNQGYVTIVPIDGDYTASRAELPSEVTRLSP